MSAAAVKLKVAEPLVCPAGMVTAAVAGAVKSELSAVSAAMETVKAAGAVRAGDPSGRAARTVTVRESPSAT